MSTDIGLLVLGFVLGGVFSCLIVYIILSKKAAAYEGQARSAEAVSKELRQQLEQMKQELSQVQNDLKNESEIRAAREAQYHEAEKNYQ